MPVRRSAEEVAHLGDEIYERNIRRQVEGTRHGEVVAIHVDSGSYAVDGDALAASERLLAQHPEADVWCVRVGYRALRHFGDRPMRRAE